MPGLINDLQIPCQTIVVGYLPLFNSSRYLLSINSFRYLLSIKSSRYLLSINSFRYLLSINSIGYLLYINYIGDQINRNSTQHLFSINSSPLIPHLQFSLLIISKYLEFDHNIFIDYFHLPPILQHIYSDLDIIDAPN